MVKSNYTLSFLLIYLSKHQFELGSAKLRKVSSAQLTEAREESFREQMQKAKQGNCFDWL